MKYSKKQEKSGVEVFTEGLLTWHDFLATVAIKAGFKPNGLARYFENNLYYRVPVFDGELKKPALDDFRLLAGVTGKRLKAVISCLTPFCLSACRQEIFEKFASLVMQEIQELFELAKDVQLDEPILVFDPELFSTFLEVVDTYEFKGNLWISTYFGGINEKVYFELVDRFDVVCLDFVEGFEENVRNVREFGCYTLCAGIADGRNTRLESLEELRSKLEAIESVGVEVLYVSTNTGLEFLPEIKAYEKMRQLSKLKGESDV